MVNGRIVWLLPHQNGNFTQAKMQKADLKILAKSVKKAKPDGKLNAPSVKEAQNYLNYMINTWKTHPVKSPFFNNARIRLDRMSYNHLFQTKGKPTEHLISGGNESYSVIGKANINGTEQGIKVIISKHTDGRYFYLSVFSLKKI